MLIFSPRLKRLSLLLLFLFSIPAVQAEQKIPDALKSWEDWATWNEHDRHCPTAFNDATKHFCFYPSKLTLQAGPEVGRFTVGVSVFHETWIELPGDDDLWPVSVLVNGKASPVVNRSGHPSMRLPAGYYSVTGEYRWAEIPEKIRIPMQYGIASLSVDGKAMPFPNWDNDGFLWLKRARTEEGDKDFLGIQVYRMIEDGIPMWLHTVMELSVSGKSREAELGYILPEGWSLSSVESPIPVIVTDQGMVKVQVRAGKWFIRLKAFRTVHADQFKMKQDLNPIVEKELVAFKADPEFRMIDIKSATPVDVTQTTFPQEWRELPVYQWITKSPIVLEEKMRGSGLQSPKSMKGSRNIWLYEKGHGYTYQDNLSGTMQSIWRLDAPGSLQLGSVKVNGEGQLITRNPTTGASGVEIRSRNLSLEALGTSTIIKSIPATGWNLDLDSLSLTMNLPPGWRLFALFGAESVDGDWLTSWTLLDLFLLLIFSIAIYRLWGIKAGMIALLAFGLTYHEPNSPRFAWFALLVPLALLKVVPEGKIKKLLTVWKYGALIALVVILLPFTYKQIQSVLYPQMELVGDREGWRYGQIIRGVEMRGEAFALQRQQAAPAAAPDAAAGEVGAFNEEAEQQMENNTVMTRSSGWPLSSGSYSKKSTKDYKYEGNMMYEAKTRIQTGPGVPAWTWRTITCHWNGPVSSAQNITPILIPPFAQKIIILTGLGLIFWLIKTLLGVNRSSVKFSSGGGKIVLWFLTFLFAIHGNASAQQIPDKETLELLKKRTLEVPDCYPQCAELTLVNLSLRENKIGYDAQIDAAIQTSVPLPGRLPAWSPIKVEIDGQSNSAVQRRDGYLWIAVPQGVHHVSVEGMLPGTSEWEWSFLLKPRRVVVDAPGWSVTGLKKDGTPEQQIFFARKQTSGEKEDAAYDRREFNTLAVIDRELEIGLIWQIHNTVTRLSAPGKAMSIQIPLLKGEQVLSSGVNLNNGNVEVRLAANQDAFSWDSELPIVSEIELRAPQTERWLERWHLVSSPVWNVALTGLNPIFESQEQALIPVWRPWPGESVKLDITRPESVAGPTMTIHRVHEEVSLGNRSRNTTLGLTLQCSMGDELVLKLNPDAEVTSVKSGERKIPLRREADTLIVPVQPGMQNLQITWKENRPLGVKADLTKLQLPVESSNITTIFHPPANRWILWTQGPLRGPVVRFWVVFIASLVLAWVLSRLPLSPLNKFQWALLMIGLTQIHLIGAAIVVGWLFLLAYRGTLTATHSPTNTFNLTQVLIILATGVSLGVFLNVVYKGLLGNPEMFIVGNGSRPQLLNWYAAQAPTAIPRPEMISISVWFYRLSMLLWALWLATSLIRWLSWGWKQFNNGGWSRPVLRQESPPVPPTEK
jgi:hypothetical protein